MSDLLRQRVERFKAALVELGLDGIRVLDPIPVDRLPEAMHAEMKTVYSVVGGVVGESLRIHDLEEITAEYGRPDLNEVTGEFTDPVPREWKNFGALVGGFDFTLSGNTETGAMGFYDPEEIQYAVVDGEWLEVQEVCPRPLQFFTEYLFGPRYPELIPEETIYSSDSIPKEEWFDETWFRVLQQAGLDEQPSDG
ncbi:hypothetical protein [Glycomyces tritici]|uniref:Knr4/Smi1-like domain-containing protein n=1 Tax=Glycomyces tritici TaxID=2665176 RepID=A0ABT7YRR4_9ACTN|nr:hypothetical protein [Glycomyces tritici]MDN3241291.1 hypothetical protein [Glycomyces tritici]MDN3243314.1 hypothetical protein [Glycomyces tritici]